MFSFDSGLFSRGSMSSVFSYQTKLSATDGLDDLLSTSGLITRLVRLCPFGVCPARALELKTRRRMKTKIGVNVLQGRSKLCAKFQLRKLKVIERQNLNKLHAYLAYVFA